MDKHNIFNWNHVSEKLTENQISELKALYKFYHKKYWLAKMTYKYFKKTELACNIGSALLVAIHPFNKSRRHFEFLINDVIRG